MELSLASTLTYLFWHTENNILNCCSDTIGQIYHTMRHITWHLKLQTDFPNEVNLHIELRIYELHGLYQISHLCPKNCQGKQDEMVAPAPYLLIIC